MPCSPVYLNGDNLLWYNQMFFNILTASYKNYSLGDPYDCGLMTVPCEKNMTKAFQYSDKYTTIIFWFDILVSYFLSSLFTFCGVFGNIINILVFSKHDIASASTTTLLLALSVADFLNALTHLFLLCVLLMCAIDVSAALSGYNLFYAFLHYLTTWFSLLAFDLVSVLALQRASVIIFPFRAPQIWTKRNIQITVVFLWIFCVATCGPAFSHAHPNWTYHPYFNKVISIGYVQNINYDRIMSYHSYFPSIRLLVDFTIILISVTITIVKLRMQGKSRSHLKVTTTTNESQKKPEMSTKERNAVRMSLAVCITTGIVALVNGSFIVYYASTMSDNFRKPDASIVLYMGKCLAAFFSSFNFFLYLALSTQYKEKVKNIFCPQSESSH